MNLNFTEEFVIFGVKQHMFTDRIFDLIILNAKYFIFVKGIHNPQYLPSDFFALSTFLDDLKPSHLNLSIQICP